MQERAKAAGLTFAWAPAVDGAALSEIEREASTTALGNVFMTSGMIGCFLSHRACWQQCMSSGHEPLLILEDDASFADGFGLAVVESLSQLSALDPEWDVLLVGALGCVHPRFRYGANVLHGLMGGGWRWPRSLSPQLHVPLRPFGTHAYVVSVKGARKLFNQCKRANFHVDVSAWGQPNLRLYLATDASGRLLSTQAATGDTTIGGLADRTWLPAFTVDEYTAAEFSWAFNAPVLQLGGVVLTIGRSLTSTASLCLIAMTMRSAVWWSVAIGWFGLQFMLIKLLQVQQWPRLAEVFRACGLALCAIAILACLWSPPVHGLDDVLSRETAAAFAGARHCTLVWPSYSAWLHAFAVHLGLVGFLGAPIGALLHMTPEHRRVAAGRSAAIFAAAATHFTVHAGRLLWPGMVSWMAAFLASTFGFNTFFKALAFAHDAYPHGARADLRTWLLW